MGRVARALERARLDGAEGEAVAQPTGDDEVSPRAVPWEIERVGRRIDRRSARGLVHSPSRLAATRAGWLSADVPSEGAPPEPPGLLRYWDVARRRWRIGLLILFVIVGGVLAGMLLRKPTYTATGLLEIRPESAGAAAPVQTLFDPLKLDTDDLETQYGILRSDTLAERVLAQMARRGTPAVTRSSSALAALSSSLTALLTGAGNGAPARGTGPTTEDIKLFQRALVVDPQRGSRLVSVGYTSPDGRLSALAVNTVLDNYLQMRMEDAQHTEQWLEQQLQAAQQKLEASERRLQRYIGEHGLQVVETGKGEAAQMANERLQALHDLLAKAEAERFEKQSEAEQDRRATAARDVDSPVVQSLVVRLADLRKEQARLSVTFKEDYPALKAVTDQIGALEHELSRESQFVVTRGAREYDAAVRREALLRGALDEQNKVVQALGQQSPGHAGYESLRNDLVANQEQFTLLNQKVKEAGISAALRASSVGIVDRARPPLDPDGLPVPLTVVLAVLVGLVLALGGMFLREYFDTSMRTVADVESFGIPALGAIPTVRPGLRPASPHPLLTPHREWRRIDDHGEQSPLAEAFAALRNAVLVRDDGSSPSSRVLLVTSAQPAEGKTTVSINLALSLARLNYRVLLVDANMRFPCVQAALGLPDGPGVAEYLGSGDDWRASLHRDVRSNLDVLAGARPQTSPADLLSMPRMVRLLDEAASEYDFVVLDSPALLSHPGDVHPLATMVDSVLFTVRQGTTSREAVSAALSQLDRVSGIVLNRFGSGDAGWEEVRQTLAPGRA